MAKISSPFANPVLNKIASAADEWLAGNFPGWTFRRFQLGTEHVGFYVLNGPELAHDGENLYPVSGPMDKPEFGELARRLFSAAGCIPDVETVFFSYTGSKTPTFDREARASFTLNSEDGKFHGRTVNIETVCGDLVLYLVQAEDPNSDSVSDDDEYSEPESEDAVEAVRVLEAFEASHPNKEDRCTVRLQLDFASCTLVYNTSKGSILFGEESYTSLNAFKHAYRIQ